LHENHFWSLYIIKNVIFYAFPYTLGNYYVSISMFSLHPRWIQDFSSSAKKGQNKEVENKLIQKNFINISKMYLIY